jgi:hypothetical protein
MRRKLTLALIVAILAPPSGLSAETRVRPATLAELATVWVGSQPGGAFEYFRLEVNAEGTGLLTVLWLSSEPPQAYRVAATRLDGYAVTFDLLPVDAKAEPIYLRGRATARRLELEVGGTTPEWRRKILLDRYSDFMARLNAVNRRAEQYWSELKK